METLLQIITLAVVLGLAAGIFILMRKRNASREDSSPPPDLEIRLREEEAHRITLQERTERQQSDILQLREQLSQANSRASLLERENAALQEKCNAISNAAQEKEKTLIQLRGEIEGKFESLAANALRQSRTDFLKSAEESFKGHRQLNTNEIEKMLAPMHSLLDKYQSELRSIEGARKSGYGELMNELKNVSIASKETKAAADKLVNALRASPQTRGRWGEETLKRVMELAGMSEHCDFKQQPTTQREGETLRPDVILYLPGGRCLVIDAKTSLTAYLQAVEESDDKDKEARLKQHARSMRAHMGQLAAKTYWDALPTTPDFVVMFVPGDNFYSAAVERDRDLFDDSINRGVLIATPTTLIALAKAVAYGWKQEQAAQNAQEIAKLGRTFMRRLSIMGEHIAKLGGSLSASVKRYNELIGSAEHSVIPAAEKFKELSAAPEKDRFPNLHGVETTPRELKKLPDSESEKPAA